MNTRIIAAALALAFAPAAASAAILTSNGDFESGLSGWTVGGGVVALPGSVYADGIGTGATAAQRANTYVFFGGGNVTDTNTLGQSFTVISGKTYTYSFDVLTVGNGSQALSYDFGGSTGSVSPFSSNNFNTVQTITGSFVATGSTASVGFTNASFNDNIDVVIDNVAVSGAVPEPAAWAMLITGFGLVGTAMRRRPSISVAG